MGGSRGSADGLADLLVVLGECLDDGEVGFDEILDFFIRLPGGQGLDVDFVPFSRSMAAGCVDGFDVQVGTAAGAVRCDLEGAPGGGW